MSLKSLFLMCFLTFKACQYQLKTGLFWAKTHLFLYLNENTFYGFQPFLFSQTFCCKYVSDKKTKQKFCCHVHLTLCDLCVDALDMDTTFSYGLLRVSDNMIVSFIFSLFLIQEVETEDQKIRTFRLPSLSRPSIYHEVQC